MHIPLAISSIITLGPAIMSLSRLLTEKASWRGTTVVATLFVYIVFMGCITLIEGLTISCSRNPDGCQFADAPVPRPLEGPSPLIAPGVQGLYPPGTVTKKKHEEVSSPLILPEAKQNYTYKLLHPSEK